MRYIDNVRTSSYSTLARALEQRRAWGYWMSKQHWQLFGTLTFSENVTVWYALRTAGAWVTSLGLGAYAWVAIERGKAGRIHAHVLVGGLYDGRAQHPDGSPATSALARARRQWALGNAEIEKYKPWLGGAWYCSKAIDEWEIIGQMRRHRKRRHRCRKRIKTLYSRVNRRQW